MRFEDRAVQDLERVVDVDELQPRVPAEHGRDDRRAEVAGERRVGVPADQRREPQYRRGHLRPAPAEPAHVPLDVQHVAREAAARDLPWLGVLGEHGRVAERRPVRGGRGPYHDLPQVRRALAGGQELHRADDVLLLHRRPATGLGTGAGGDVQVHDRLDPAPGDDPGRLTGADVSALELDGVTEDGGLLAGRLPVVQADHPFDPGIGGQPRGDLRAQVPGDTGDQHHPWRGGGGHRCGGHLPRRRRWTLVLRSSLRCFFFAMRLRRFLTTEPIWPVPSNLRCLRD